MDTLIYILGFLVFVVGLLLAAAVGVCALVRAFERFKRAVTDERDDLVHRRVANKLHQDGYWLSEDPLSQFLVQHIATGLASGTYDIRETREAWRAERKRLKSLPEKSA